MYSQNDLDEAVGAGAITADAAQALRAFIDGQRGLSNVDDENFWLLTGFNDIFVNIAALICWWPSAGSSRSPRGRSRAGRWPRQHGA